MGVSVSTNPYSFRIVSAWMQNGNVMEYARSNPGENRLQLVSPLDILLKNPVLRIRNDFQLSEVMSGMIYLHELGIVHGDLKGVRSNFRNRVSRLTDHLNRQTFSLTTMAPLSSRILALQQCRSTLALFPCLRLLFLLRERSVG